jgi:hypothetical protein
VSAGVAAALLLVVLPSVGAGAHAQESPWLDRVSIAVPSATHRLPGRLREISGLAATADGRLFGHDDERGVVYEIDIDTGELLKGFALGDRAARADFEGIAAAHGRIYLVTSAGTIYETREGADDERMLFNTYGTGLGRRCEVEGLAHEPARDALLLACKNPREDALEGTVAIFFWSFETRELSGSPLRIDETALAAAVGEDRFQPSGIEWVRDTGTYLLVAGPQRALAGRGTPPSGGGDRGPSRWPARDRRRGRGPPRPRHGVRAPPLTAASTTTSESAGRPATKGREGS